MNMTTIPNDAPKILHITKFHKLQNFTRYNNSHTTYLSIQRW